MPPSPATTNPRLPADHGLPSLGLIALYLSAGVTLYLTLVLFFTLVGQSRGSDRLVMVGLLALGFVRAGFHRALGDHLLRRSPLVFAAATRYVVVSAVVTAGMAGLLAASFGPFLTPTAYVAFAVVAMHWPLIILVLVRRRRVVEAFEAADTFDIPLAPRDRSIEGAGVLMTVLGAIGLAGALAGLTLALVDLGGSLPGVLLIITLALITARAAYHLFAGVRAIRLPIPAAFDASISRYLGFALATAGATALTILVTSRGQGIVIALAVILITTGLLLFWPLALRRFATQVRMDESMAEDSAPIGPAPDRGLTSYGYLLAALGGMTLAFAAAKLIVGASVPGLGALLASGFEAVDVLSVVSGGVALWAAREVLAMSDRRAAAIYAYAASQVVTLVVSWALDGLPFDGEADPSALVALIFASASLLATPIVGVVLLRRRLPVIAPQDGGEVTPPRGTPALTADAN